VVRSSAASDVYKRQPLDLEGMREVRNRYSLSNRLPAVKDLRVKTGW
jgi:hypothetical protein